MSDFMVSDQKRDKLVQVQRDAKRICAEKGFEYLEVERLKPCYRYKQWPRYRLIHSSVPRNERPECVGIAAYEYIGKVMADGRLIRDN